MVRIRHLAFTSVLLCCLAAYAGDGEIHKNEHAIKDRYLVVLDDSVQRHEARGAAEALAAMHGARIRTVWTAALRGFAAEMPEGRARAMSRDPRVKFVEEDAEVQLSATVPTNFDPSQACDPAVQSCPPTAENRLWNLDRLEQNSAALNQRFGYCSTGAGVYIYVVDTGVMAQHSEFWTSETNTAHPRVLSGYSAAERVPNDPNNPDHAPADNPLGGWGTTATEIYLCGHGTSVASVAAGRKVGFAKAATIVPVKAVQCFPGFATSLSMFADGADWIVRVRGEEPDPNDGNPDAYRDASGNVRLLHPAVATFSIFQQYAPESAFELALDSLHAANVTVVASANNQNADACTTTPARHSRNNPDVAKRGKVITVGGSQILNSPMNKPVSNGVYDSSKPTTDGRWICDPAIDDSACGPNPGSNYGQCVSLFAPSRNITSASMAGPRVYRTGMGGGLDDSQKTNGSGTSFAAPLVAGAVARILEQFAPQYRTPDNIYAQLTDPGLNNLQGVLDPATLGAGSPNIMPRFGDVGIAAQPVSRGVDANGNATLTVTATTGIPPLHYQWFRVTNPSFVDPSRPPLGWPVTTAIGTDANSIVVSPASRSSYFVRVTNECCETDSNIASVYPRPGAPQNVVATPNVTGTTVNVTWTSSDANAEQFQVYQQTSAASGLVLAGTTTGTTFPVATTPDTARVYAVRALAGVVTAAPAASNFSNRDLAVTVPFTDSPIDSTVRIKSTHVVEIRRAVNALCDHLGFARIYSNAETLYSSLQNVRIFATHWSTLQTQINNMRTNPAIGAGPFAFREVPVAGMPIRKIHIDDLRSSVQ